MPRTLFVVATLCVAVLADDARAHDHAAAHGCMAGPGETCYEAFLDNDHTPNSPHDDATGYAHLELNSERTELRYNLAINGLHLKPNEADRTELNDILGVHLHLSIPGTLGPHVLNIFGLAAPGIAGEDDADLIVDYETNSLSGIFDITDASVDPATGELYLQNLPLTSKVIYDWLDDLDEGRLMLAVHTVASGFGVMGIHGHIHQVVPEPAAWLLMSPAFAWLLLTRPDSTLRRLVAP